MATSNTEPLSPAAQALSDTLKASGHYDRPFGITLTTRVPEAKEHELLEKIKVAITETRKEKGNIQYDFSRDLKEPVFILSEKWENGPALENHVKFDYTKELLGKIHEIGSETSLRLTSLIVPS